MPDKARQNTHSNSERIVITSENPTKKKKKKKKKKIRRINESCLYIVFNTLKKQMFWIFVRIAIVSRVYLISKTCYIRK